MTPTAIGSLTAGQQDADAVTPTPEQRKAARDFEAIFLRQLLSSLEKSSGLSGGQSSGGQIFRSMMVSALADTASEGGGIGMSELILKAMMPPAPQGRPDLSLQAATPATPSASAGAGIEALSAEPARSARLGVESPVLTKARSAPMLGGTLVRPTAPLLEGTTLDGSWPKRTWPEANER